LNRHVHNNKIGTFEQTVFPLVGSDLQIPDDILDARPKFRSGFSFLTTAVGPGGFPSRIEGNPPPPEIAFCGRSNVGKSSLLNGIARQHGLAKSSNTPGKTQEVNFFPSHSNELTLVDLPGYGYGRAPLHAVDSWNVLIGDYIRSRECLRRVLVLCDARRGGLVDLDKRFLDLLLDFRVPFQIVFTKVDLLSATEFHKLFVNVREQLLPYAAAAPAGRGLVPFFHAVSAKRNIGLDSLRNDISLAARSKPRTMLNLSPE